MSRFHLGQQHDGRGWMIIRLSALHAGFDKTTAMVVECNLPEDVARDRLLFYRATEQKEAS